MLVTSAQIYWLYLMYDKHGDNVDPATQISALVAMNILLEASAYNSYKAKAQLFVQVKMGE